MMTWPKRNNGLKISSAPVPQAGALFLRRPNAQQANLLTICPGQRRGGVVKWGQIAKKTFTNKECFVWNSVPWPVWSRHACFVF